MSIANIPKFTRVALVCDGNPMPNIKGAERARRESDEFQLLQILSGEHEFLGLWNSFFSCAQIMEDL